MATCEDVLVQSIAEHFGPKAQGLNMEGNYYYNNDVCGIGFHGDTGGFSEPRSGIEKPRSSFDFTERSSVKSKDDERRKVIGIRLGASIPIHFQWFHHHQASGDPYVIPLQGGDMYVMSEKAVGADWKSSSILTLRHAVGLRFTTVKVKINTNVRANVKAKAKAGGDLAHDNKIPQLHSIISEPLLESVKPHTRKLRIVSILVKNRRATKQLRDLKAKGYTIIDVTSKSETHAYLSPFFPQGGITVGQFVSESVEGLYQGLKVFQEEGIDVTKFRIRNMKNLKRTVRSCGKVMGHHNPLLASGETGTLLDYVSARLHIYIPAYQQVLWKHHVELSELRERLLVGEKVCLVDYNTNAIVTDLRSPLSHRRCHLKSLKIL